MIEIPEPSASRIRNAVLFLLDLDGTVYLGNEPIPGATRFIERLVQRKTGYVFLTNNSSRAASDYLQKLNGLGFPAGCDNIFTSGQAAGMHVAAKKPGARVFVLGTGALCRELQTFGLMPVPADGEIDFIIAGFDTELTFEKLSAACALVDRGVPYVATNPDYVCPIEGGRYLPDCGCICYMIEKATGKTPLVIGKPDRGMADLVCSRFKAPAGKTVLIGDRLYTDIALGCNAGIFTVCVLTGETKRRDIDASAIRPDCVIDSIDDLNPMLEGAVNVNEKQKKEVR